MQTRVDNTRVGRAPPAMVGAMPALRDVALRAGMRVAGVVAARSSDICRSTACA